MQADTSLAKLRNELFGFGYPAKFPLPRHNNLLGLMRRCALMIEFTKAAGPRLKGFDRRFFYALLIAEL
jgi:hypothetical protein